ncbi:MAG: hypothetical protein LBK71_08715, partial [Verrucomicrobiales bacterium]|nr:hypothetical protein [Verrucomicrobiales bacterium]
VVALWRCGVVALWRCGVVALWRCGVLALWRCGVESFNSNWIQFSPITAMMSIVFLTRRRQ